MTKLTLQHNESASLYVVGFVLSLGCTLLPFYLVSEGRMIGPPLMIAVFVFAVLQMLIQLFFFLHLGSGKSPVFNVALIISTIGFILMVVIGSIFIMNQLDYYHSQGGGNFTAEEITLRQAQDEKIYQLEGRPTGACQSTKTNHQVVIKNHKASPSLTIAGRCDTITFISDDNDRHAIRFGTHDKHDNYGGIEVIEVTDGHNETIVLNTLGEHTFHDHLNEEISGTIKVSTPNDKQSD